MKKRIYLDYASSTPIDKKVLDAMMPYLKKEYGNPSSSHWFGQQARAAIEQAREKAGRFLGCSAMEIVFTSGATEANNFAILGALNVGGWTPHIIPHVITSQIEHESVRAVAQQLEKEGKAEITYLPVTKDGFVRPKDVENAIKEHTVLVSIQYVNSEIGSIQPIAEIGKILEHHQNILFHTDAVQAAYYLNCSVGELKVDLLTLSAHKIYGPKGVGLLYIKKDVDVKPQLVGGGQEFDMRAGTEHVAGIAGMGQALQELQSPKLPVTNINVRHMRDKLIKGVLRRVPDSKLTGSTEKRITNNAHFHFKGIEGKDLVIVLDQKGVAASTGSACSEKTQEASHVLLALGLSQKDALGALRVTVGKHTTLEEIEKAIKCIVTAVEQLRKTRV